MGKNKIIPHLWFDRQAREAAEFYTSVFPDSRIISARRPCATRPRATPT
jgi:predicted 3-demethylubiquinone-9 3-methyltransferase (glyoxalase superfamily)